MLLFLLRVVPSCTSNDMFDIMPPIPSLHSRFVQLYLAVITLALTYWALNVLWYTLSGGLIRLPQASLCTDLGDKVACCETWRVRGLPVGPGCEGVCQVDSAWPFCQTFGGGKTVNAVWRRAISTPKASDSWRRREEKSRHADERYFAEAHIERTID